MDRNNKICLARIMRTALSIGVALFILGAAIPPDNGYARGKFKPEVRLPEGYPDGFDGFGQINRIAPDVVVIDDTKYRFIVHVEYNTPRERNTLPALFVPGKFVGFLLDSQGQVTSLWMIE